MALVRPFLALRPSQKTARAVAAVPYDVVSTEEARNLSEGNPLSFLRVSRAEIELSVASNLHSEEVYRKAADNFTRLKKNAPLIIEDSPSLYCYQLQDGEHEQTGLAGCYSLDEYDRNLIKKHELTRHDKEDDRTRHILALRAQTGLVFLTYRASEAVETVQHRACQQDPLFDFTAEDGVRHTIWKLNETDEASAIKAVNMLPALYIADGHHRIASAARARNELASTGEQTANLNSQFVLGVAFPHTATRILAYNRAVANLGKYTIERFLEEIRSKFSIHQNANPNPPKGQVAMYIGGTWHGIDLSGTSITTTSKAAKATCLDAALLQNKLLTPLLGIKDVRTDPRMTFIGGSHGTKALEEMVDSGKEAVAFSVAPVTPQELLEVSDAGEIMPPKSTWFEPKLRDGLLIHLI